MTAKVEEAPKMCRWCEDQAKHRNEAGVWYCGGCDIPQPGFRSARVRRRRGRKEDR